MPATPGKYPVVMQRTPYNRVAGLPGTNCDDSQLGGVYPIAWLAEHGYVAISQDVRGRYRSEGVFSPIQQEQNDGYDAVEWAAVQPWSTGKVGLFGLSYFGLTQWQAAITTPPHLAAIAPNVTSTDYHDHWTYRNGVFDLWFAQSWLLTDFAPDEYHRRLEAQGVPPAVANQVVDAWYADGANKIYSDWIWTLPPASLTAFSQPPLAPYYYEWLNHPNYDSYWARVDIERHYGNVKVPALIMGGWYDIFSIGSIRSFQGLRQQGGSNISRSGTKLVMQGGGVHGGDGAINWGPNNPSAWSSTPFVQQQHLRFYDRYLKGIDNGIDAEPAVSIFVQVPPDAGTQGDGYMLHSNEFPLPGTQKVRFNLSSNGKANTRLGGGVLDAAKPSRGPDDNFVYNPADPVISSGGGNCCSTSALAPFGGGAQDQSTVELRDDVLVYTSEPLEHDMAVIGQATVRFWAKTSARDTDFTAKLVDVHPDGFAHNVLDRVVRTRFRKGSKQPPSLIEPNKPYEYFIDLGPTATVFKAGHRVRLDISSSNFPNLARNLNTGGGFGDESRITVAKQTIMHNPGHPSFLELDVAPGVTAKKD